MSQASETDPARDVVRRATALNADHGLFALKEWKAAHPGQLAIGHMPIYVPRPLLEAMDCLPVAVFGAGEKEIVRGDSYFQSYLCHIPPQHPRAWPVRSASRAGRDDLPRHLRRHS